MQSIAANPTEYKIDALTNYMAGTYQ
jgi:hypothetical protein